MHKRVNWKSWRLGVLVAVLAAVGSGLVLGLQLRAAHARETEDLLRRAHILAYRVTPAVTRALQGPDDAAQAALDERLDGYSRLLGLAVWRGPAEPIAAGQGVRDLTDSTREIVARAFADGEEIGEVRRDTIGTTHVLAVPILDAQRQVTGVITVLHDAAYLDSRVARGVLLAIGSSLAIGALLFVTTTGVAWFIFERPLFKLAEWMRRLRFGSTPEQPPGNLPVGKLADESLHLAASFRAARAAEQVQAREIVRTDNAWTRERLRAHAVDALGGTPLIVVSNREPYMHQLREGVPVLVRPASGLVTGLDPVLRACGGLWVAHGAGDADRQMSDNAGCVPVPPEDPRYTLKRVWISKEEEQGYYYGFSNEGLWPLCHLTHERPTFRAGDWEQYVRANQRFADAVLEEIGDNAAVVMVQDYQLALVPRMIKAKRPDLRVGLFWHIPWPNPEAFRICPFRVQLLEGMLGADLLGFHLQQHCNNFLETVDRMVEAKLDWDHFAAELGGHVCQVRPFPISVQSWSERDVPHGESLRTQIATLKRQYQLDGIRIGVGVDRIDYTKGIAERFRAIEQFFADNPEYIGKFTFVQLGAPSRTHIPRYRDLVSELEAQADAINWKFQTDSWKPIRLLVGHHEGPMVHAFFRMAEVCIVSSLHDGMNLVAKEFVAAKNNADEISDADEGVLILSEFAGAARDLPEALIINPYDTANFAAAIRTALTMPGKERRQRMLRMRLRVEEANIYRWAANFLTALAQPHMATTPPAAPGASPMSATNPAGGPAK